MKRIRTNVFGPRPRNWPIGCLRCKSTDYPLFGIALEKKREPKSNTHNSCVACLTSFDLKGGEIAPTEDARKALESAGFEFTVGASVDCSE